jgi:hypothetical protein
MAVLQADDIADIAIAGLRAQGRFRLTDIASALQDYVGFRNLMRANRVTVGSGYGMQWQMMFQTSGAWHRSGLFEVDNVNVGDVLVSANIPWRHWNTNYAIEVREIAMNTGVEQIVDLAMVRRKDAMLDMIEGVESDIWEVPASGNTDQIYGFDYWLVYNATTGINGGNHGNFSSGPGNVSSSTYTRWKNGTFNYTNVSKDDLIKKWREVATKTRFMNAAELPEYGSGTEKRGYYTNYTVLGQLESLLEAQNDNLGNDLASKDGRTLFRQTPVTWVPQLDGKTGDPVYGINWDTFNFGFLPGEFMADRKGNSRSHTTSEFHNDTSVNLRCTDRRKNFVGATEDHNNS